MNRIFSKIRQKWCSSILSYRPFYLMKVDRLHIFKRRQNCHSAVKCLYYPMPKSNFNYNILAPQKVNSTFPCVFQLIFKPHLSRDSFIKLTTLICIQDSCQQNSFPYEGVMQQKQCWSTISMIQVSRKMAAQKKGRALIKRNLYAVVSPEKSEPPPHSSQ